MPGWYGVANVKWLSNIHVQDEPYMGKFQTRWYRTLREENIGGVDDAEGNRRHEDAPEVGDRARHHQRQDYKVTGLRAERRHADPVGRGEGGRRPVAAATLSPDTSEHLRWKLFTFDWNGATPGEHTLVSRVTDTNGAVQPTAADLANKKTFLEDNGQFPRKITIS